MMPSPTTLALPTAMTAPAVSQSAPDSSTWKNGNEKASISMVLIMACSTPKADMPMRWTTRGTGAIRVCSIVPSHRSHMMVRLMSSSTADRYAHTRVPMSRNMVKRGSSVWLMAPDRAASLAMNVIDRVLTTPYSNQTISHAQ